MRNARGTHVDSGSGRLDRTSDRPLGKLVNDTGFSGYGNVNRGPASQSNSSYRSPYVNETITHASKSRIAATQHISPYRSPYSNNKTVNGSRSPALGATHPTRSLNSIGFSRTAIRAPMVPSIMPPAIEETDYRAAADFPVRNLASLNRLEETRMVPKQDQHYQHYANYKEPSSGYNTADSRRHAQQPPRHPSQTGHPAAVATVSGNLHGRKNGVGYLSASRQDGDNDGLSRLQNPVGFDDLALFPSHDGLPRYYNDKPSQMSVVIPSPRSKPSWAQISERPSSGSTSPRQNLPINNLMSTTPRIEIQIMSRKDGLAQRSAHTARRQQPLAKKRGRPFATQQAAAKAASKMAARAARAARDSSVPRDEFIKKRGRPFKVPLTQADIAGPEPTFNVFVCEWRDCLAELHNAETLRRHLKIRHGKRDPSTKTFPCLWRHCAEDKTEVFDKETRPTKTVERKVAFKTEEAWENHVERAHMLRVLWYQGDGPKGTDFGPPVRLTDKEASPWLYDAKGRQITPSVKDQKVETGSARENNQKRFKKKREGLHIVFEPTDTSESYKLERASDERRIDDSDGDENDMEVD